MGPISRRNVIGVAATALVGGAVAAEVGATADDEKKNPEKKAVTNTTGESPYKFRMSTAETRRYGGSSIREHKLEHFPMSSTMSAGLIALAVGDFREPHWHPNSDEWLFVMSGNIQMTIVDGKGQASQFQCGPEDVAFTPMGFGHYVENVGDTEARVMVVHNHAEFSTVNLSEWVAGGSQSVFGSTLNMPGQAFDDAPTTRVFVGRKKKKV